MSRGLYGLGRACSGRPVIVVAVWLILAAGLLVLGARVGGQTTDDQRVAGSGSAIAKEQTEAAFPGESAGGGSPIVIHSPAGPLTTTEYRAAVEQTVEAIGRVPGVASATDPLAPGGAALSEDGRTAYITVTMADPDSAPSAADATAVLDAAAPARAAGLQVEAGGQLGQRLSTGGTHSSEAIGLAVALVVLVLAFGAVVAGLVPIVLALVALSAGLGALSLLARVIDIPTAAPTLATMLGLGVGIDYALFIMTRRRTLRESGVPSREAVSRALSSSGGAVLFAGGTVMVAIGALAVAGIPLVTALGLASALVVGVQVAATLTLLPAILGLLGDRVDALRLRRRGGTGAGVWERMGRAVARRPWVALAISVTILLALCIPTLDLQLGQSDPGDLPTSTTARRANDLLVAGFGPGANGALQVVVELPTPAEPTDPAPAAIGAALGQTAGVATVAPPRVSEAGTTAVYRVTPATGTADPATADLVDRLRAETLPAALPAGAAAWVGGAPAAGADLADRVSERLPLIIGLVVAISMVLLLVAFRSVAVPVKAALMNLLSVGAAYGVVVAVFEWGWGVELLGLDGPVPVVSFVPMMMFAVLFGLSMDYEVFLLSRVRERHTAGMGNTDAVVAGLADTGAVITSAALIMVSVFASFVVHPDPVIKMFGLGLAAAVLIDATIVRCLLVPAAMILMGRANWWLPGWLDRRLPDLRLEGREEPAAR